MAQPLPIASVDLADFRSADPARRQRFVQALGDSFSRIGFAAVTGHDLDDALQTRLFDEVQAFFALPEAAKRRYEIPGIKGQRGYSAYGAEKARSEKVADMKEFWQHGQTHAASDPLHAAQPPNVEVAERPHFTPVLLSSYAALESTGRDLLRAISLYLDLPEDFFDTHIQGGLSILRAIHYPPITHEPDSAVRAAAHEDINLITLLMGASAQGLEVRTRDGQWLPIMAPPGYLTLNVGDMLQRLTNRRLVSTTHRVVNPPRELWGTSRYSVPFFLHPRPEMDLSCLPSCIDAVHPKQFDDISAHDYLQERLREIRAQRPAA
ncbi:MAG: 2-oxoglutarate and iron-dependent oxygenase domain-containing protein [Comamonas sp.]